MASSEENHRAADIPQKEVASGTQLLQVMELLIDQLHSLQMDNIKLLDEKLRLEAVQLLPSQNPFVLCVSLHSLFLVIKFIILSSKSIKDSLQNHVCSK